MDKCQIGCKAASTRHTRLRMPVQMDDCTTQGVDKRAPLHVKNEYRLTSQVSSTMSGSRVWLSELDDARCSRGL